MDRELTRRHVLAGLGGASALFFGAVAATFDPPRVVSVESEFGTVRERTADVDTTMVVENPNGRAIPGRHAVEYSVTLDGITVADGRKRGIRIGPERTVVQTTARFDNTAIPEWWATHVNSGEESTMRTRSRVDPAGLPFGVSLPVEETRITTDFLESLGKSESSAVLLGDREIITVGDQRAEWGEADEDRSPLRVTTQVENVHERPVRIDGTDYEIRMNEVVVGSGETDDPVELAPGESAAFTVEAAIETPRTQQWWVSHLRNDETTDLTVAVYAVAVDDEGTRRRLPLAILDQQSTFETDLLGTGETVVEPVESEPPAGFADPTVEETTSDWGEVGADETAIETTVAIRNDNEEAFTDLLSLEVDRETTIAGVTVASGTDRVESLPRGEGEIGLTSTKPHAVVPEWWAAHLRNGERSASRTGVTAEADVTVTTLPLDFDDRETVVSSDLLAGLDDDTRQTVAVAGATLFVVHGTTSEWVDPTPERGPVRVEADIENVGPTALTISGIDVSIDSNGVVLADERLPGEYAFDAGERRTVTFRLTLDNSQMEAWWPTHVRNGEVSEVTREVTATIEGTLTSDRTTLDFLSADVRVETALLRG